MSRTADLALCVCAAMFLSACAAAPEPEVPTGAGATAVTADAPATSGMSFNQIMSSAAAAGPMPNADGHVWSFRQDSSGAWLVDGARGNTARVTSAGADRVEISGFPGNWGADGIFVFSESDGRCILKSDHSRHRLDWEC